MKPSYRAHWLSGVMASACLMYAGPASAQDAEVEEDETAVQQTVIVTGARGQPRSVFDSPVPIDVISSEDLQRVAFTDTNDILKTLVPSYALTRQPISDGASFIRPATLRGLPTDKTLVLLNSKRRHRAALVRIGGSGTQGPDIATIPAIALKNVEVLRDGAAAQYGSDAIAGVINFILKDDAEGASVILDTGQHYEGDGEAYTISGNIGLPIGEDGFINLSAEITEMNATLRGNQYCTGGACVDPKDPRYLMGSDFDTSVVGYTEESYVAGLPSANIGFGDVVQPWGQPNAEAMRFFANAAYTFNEFAEVYAFANSSTSESDGSFFYRFPGNGTIENIRLQEVIEDGETIVENGEIWSPLEIFPGGFTPRFSGEVFDLSFVGGLRGELANGLAYDISGRYGRNEIEYTIQNTINPSLGPDTPTIFSPGDLINEEIQYQADFSKPFDVGLASPLVFAFGLSYFDETYELTEGDLASYDTGPFAEADPFGFCNAETRMPTEAGANIEGLNCANFKDDDTDGFEGIDPVYTVVGVGSNGFPGYSPDFSGTYNRDSYAIYGDVSGDVTDKLFLQGAVRFEDYSDFGSETVWKLAGRYEVTDAFAIRGSIGTGFRAPTPGQQGTTNVSTRLPNGVPVATGLFPPSSSVAQALGAVPLEPETSTNYTFGFTTAFDDFTLTFDMYRIELQDRFNAISTQDVSATPVPLDEDDPNFDADDAAAYRNFLALEAAGVTGASSIGGVNYFTNAFDTVTQGFDIVATYSKDWDGLGVTLVTASVNYNEEEFDGDVTDLFNEESRFDFENGTPEWRGVISANHDVGPWSFLVRANLYGPYENSDSSAGVITSIQEFAPIVQFDLEGTYHVNDQVSLSAGVRNLFDEYPNRTIVDQCCGLIYRSDSIADWQGGFYYARAVMNF